jgi:hypothetical protein
VKRVVAVGSVLLVLLGCLVGFGLSEAGFRSYLYLSYPQMFQRRDQHIAAYDISHWGVRRALRLRLSAGKS